MILMLVAFVMIVVYLLPLLHLDEHDLRITLFSVVVITGILWTVTVMRLQKSIPCFIIATVMLLLSVYNYLTYQERYKRYERNMLINPYNANLQLQTDLRRVDVMSLWLVGWFVVYIAVALHARSLANTVF